MPLIVLIMIILFSAILGLLMLTDPFIKTRYGVCSLLLSCLIALWIAISGLEEPRIESEQEVPVIIKNNIAYVYYDNKFHNISEKFMRNFTENDIVIVKTFSHGPYLGIYAPMADNIRIKE